MTKEELYKELAIHARMIADTAGFFASGNKAANRADLNSGVAHVFVYLYLLHQAGGLDLEKISDIADVLVAKLENRE